MLDQMTSLYETRRDLYQRFGVAPVAYSADGRQVQWAAPLEAGVQIGTVAVAELDDGDGVVLQVRDAQVVEREGPELAVDLDGGRLAAFAGSARVAPMMRASAGSAVVLGHLRDGEFSPVGAASAFGELPLRPATDAELHNVAAGLAGRHPTIVVGSHRQSAGVPARLHSKGFSRHTFMCGQSGSGKTYTTGVLFERLLASTGLPLVIIDPNSDHIHLGSLADPDDSTPDGIAYRELAGSVIVASARGHDGDVVLCADLSDFNLSVQALLLRLHPIRDLDDYAMLRQLTSALPERYSIHDLAAAAAADPASKSLAVRIDNLGLADWDLWRRDGEQSLVHETPGGPPRCLVLNVGSLSRADERTAVSLVLLGNRWARRRERTPMLIAIDEAHNVLPAASADPLLQETAELGALIAGEGRKFGLHLFVATQRPGKVHPNVVSQCDNLVLMRMNGAGDVQDLEQLFSHVPAPLLRQSTSFGLGQALFAGPIAPVPLLAQVGSRLTREGGGDVPTTWAVTG